MKMYSPFIVACFATFLSLNINAQSNTFPSNGNVGVGTTSPAYKVHVEGNVEGSVTVAVKNNNTGTSFPQAKFEVLNSSGSSGQLFKAGVNWATSNVMYANDMVLWNGGSGNMVFYNQTATGKITLTAGAASTAHVTLLPSGYLGIGTTTPSEKLSVTGNAYIVGNASVNGNIVTKKVKVTQSGWADYVFHPTYKLPPLNEVEAFIKKHQHLQDIPSAEEVEKKGLDLGANQAALLKKIEELTLYVIDQNKKIESLQQEVKSIKVACKKTMQLAKDNTTNTSK